MISSKRLKIVSVRSSQFSCATSAYVVRIAIQSATSCGDTLMSSLALGTLFTAVTSRGQPITAISPALVLENNCSRERIITSN